MNQRPSTITPQNIADTPLHTKQLEPELRKKILKKSSIKRVIKTFKGRLFWTTLLTVSWLGGSDYQITTVIQLHASNHEAHKSHYTYQTPQVLAASNRNTSHARQTPKYS